MNANSDLSLWEVIGIERRRQGMTVKGLAEKAGLHRNYVSQLERGKANNPSLSALIAVFDALGLDLDIKLIEKAVKE